MPCPHAATPRTLPSDTKTRDRQLAIVLFFSTALMVVGAVGTLGDFSQGKLKSLWGFTAIGGCCGWQVWVGGDTPGICGRAQGSSGALGAGRGGCGAAPGAAATSPRHPLLLTPALPLCSGAAAILLLFYSAPLSTVLLVLRTRNSVSLQLSLSVMNLINGEGAAVGCWAWNWAA